MNKTFKLVIVGGGSTYTPGIVKSLLDKKDSFKLSELRLYDNLEGTPGQGGRPGTESN